MKKPGKLALTLGGVLLLGAVLCAAVLLRPARRTSFVLAEGLASQTECHILDSGRSGPAIFLLAGTHGNEVAGYLGAEQLLRRLQPRSGRIILVPYANRQAIDRNERTGKDGEDMNRAYPGDPDGTPIQVLAAQIMDVISEQDPVCVVDMHEGKNFYGVGGSIGNSLVVGQTVSGFSHALDILDAVNAQNGDLPDFALEGSAPAGSLNGTASRRLGIDAFTIETSQQLPLETRVEQQLLFVECILKSYGMEFQMLPE